MNDLQIVSGLATLISGYYLITRRVSVYHWKMIVQIAWLSTITHLGALSCLRSYLYRNKTKRSLRLVFTLFLTVMLSVAIISSDPASSYDDTPSNMLVFRSFFLLGEWRIRSRRCFLFYSNASLQCRSAHYEATPVTFRSWVALDPKKIDPFCEKNSRRQYSSQIYH